MTLMLNIGMRALEGLLCLRFICSKRQSTTLNPTNDSISFIFRMSNVFTVYIDVFGKDFIKFVTTQGEHQKEHAEKKPKVEKVLSQILMLGL